MPCVDSCPERTEDGSELVKLELLVNHQTQILETISCLLEGQEVLIISEFSSAPISKYYYYAAPFFLWK